MRLTSIGKFALAAIVLHSVVPACLAQNTATSGTLVEVWTGGDDALTQRLAEAVREAFKKSPEFTPSYGQKPNTLKVLIPTHVDWEKIGKRTKVRSKIEFSWPGTDREVSTSSVECWDDTPAKCADDVISDAKRVVRDVRTPNSR